MNNINQQINKLKLLLILSLMNKKNQEETNDITQLLLLCIEAITQIDTEEGETHTTQIEGVEAIANNYKSNSNNNSKKSSDEEINRNLCPSVLICENLCYDNAIDGGNRPVSVTIGATFSLMKETFMENYSPDFSRANAQLALMAQPTNGGYFTFKSEKDIIAENLRNHRGLYYSDNRGAAEREVISLSNSGDDSIWVPEFEGKFGFPIFPDFYIGALDKFNPDAKNVLNPLFYNNVFYPDSLVYPATGPKMLQYFQDKGEYYKVQVWKGSYPWGMGGELGIYKWHTGEENGKYGLNYNSENKQWGYWMPYTSARGGGNFQVTLTFSDQFGNEYSNTKNTWWSCAGNPTMNYRDWRNFDMSFSIKGLSGWDSNRVFNWKAGEKDPLKVFGGQ